ncbi:hypothetical protein FISHEDRAFT_53017 [Fistulina hepatica ATCC 64428]|nr:hypothetical protein FISHEDRAFT_53017 [Fistulina hepatica ATCC 64428]
MSQKRIERTKLERRLEKLIALHFSDLSRASSTSETGVPRRRTSSLFSNRPSSIYDLKRLVVEGGKFGTRAEEQRITPWEDDAVVSQCPICTAHFHPLTNRKHHCRLCGHVICAQLIKPPLRPVPCSYLFVADPVTRKIEEVDEGVDYGVRKKRPPVASPSQQPSVEDEEKFLKGVRICRDCRPVLLRQQYQQEAQQTPMFLRYHQTLMNLERDIENYLPQFQELLLTLSHDDRPTKEASAARKRLLEAFAEYDALSKRLRQLPTPQGSDSSQDRVQQAILTRASIFLQKNMFPLQSLPTSKRHKKSASTATDTVASEALPLDMDSAAALALQPLLEQEALLETFIEEATARRKFEDIKTLKANLQEIRTEIERFMKNAESGVIRGLS